MRPNQRAAELSGRLLAPLITLLAPTPVVGPVPGWRFAIAEDQPTRAVQRRLALWRLWERGTVAGSVVLPWFDGLRYKTVLGTDLTRCTFVSGSYEPNEFALLRNVLGPGMTFVDIGANEGLYALFAARGVGPTGHVVALEPSTRERNRLLRNVALNGLGNVDVLAYAASDRAGYADLLVAEAEHAGHNTLGDFAYTVRASHRERVELIPLERIVERVGLHRVDAIKIDAEGHELAVLRGARGLIAAHHPLLIVELLEAALRPQDASVRAVLDEILSFGYRFFMFGPKGEPEPADVVEGDGFNVVTAHPDGPGLDDNHRDAQGRLIGISHEPQDGACGSLQYQWGE